jgi:hypothetical protein
LKYLSDLFRSATGIVLASAVLSGCAVNMKVPLKDPPPSAAKYQKTTQPAPVTLAFKDDRNEADKALVTGVIPMQVVYNDKPFEATPWVAQHIVKEMTARGLPVTLGDGQGSTPVLIKRIRIENHRASGFSPFVTFTSVRAEVLTASGLKTITSYVKRGKVPIMSFDEVIDPTYNAPLGIVTKEIATKLNQQLFRQAISDEEVGALIRKINQDATAKSNDTYLQVYQLGFGNNPRAVPELVKLSSHTDEYVRLAAVSSLGILKANDQYAFLSRLYENSTLLWQDRAMALKAIGDLGTPESRAYLLKQQALLEGRKDKDATWTKEIIALYL